MISIDGFEYNQRCQADGSEMTLMEKLRESYHGRWHDPRATAISDRMGTAFFWFITVSELYLAVQYVVPHQFAEYSDWTRYCIKVMCWFLFVQTIANWTCIRYCDTSYRVTNDRPTPPVINRQNVGLLIPKVTTNGWNGFSRTTKQLENKQVKENGAETSNGTDNGSSLSWRWCKWCQHNQPPRSHHCIICRRCILKRDHHCYITGVCVGLTNQRHFVIMNFYITIACAVGLYYISAFLGASFVPRAEFLDYVLPVTTYRWAFGSGWIETHLLLMIIQMYSLWWIGFGAIGFVTWHIAIISVGKTTREVRTGANVRCTASVAENFRSVFGALWMLNFLFPAHIAFRQMSDGICWENVKKLSKTNSTSSLHCANP